MFRVPSLSAIFALFVLALPDAASAAPVPAVEKAQGQAIILRPITLVKLADMEFASLGVTTGGTIGATSARTLDRCVAEIDSIAEAARKVREDVMVICHGGPISMPDDARYILERIPGLHGFYGASSMERLPAERAIASQTADFKSITIGGRKN